MESIKRDILDVQPKISSSIDIRDAFFDELYNIAAEDKDVIFLTADMGAFSLERFRKDLPAQYINVGPAEQNLISIAAGLALGGKKVFVYGIAPFVTQRCYEQIKIDLCCMKLPVTIVGAGAGIAYTSDGPTHHAKQDISIMRALPEMTILNPSDSLMAAASARLTYKNYGPSYVRIDKGKLPILYNKDENFSDGLAVLKPGKDLTIIATGLMVHQAFKVADELAKFSIDTGIIDLYRIKPINTELLLSSIRQSKEILTLEEHSIIGGIGSAASEVLVDSGLNLPMKRIAITEKHCTGHGSREWMHSFYSLDVGSVVEAILGRQLTGVGSRQRRSGSKDCPCPKLALEDFANLFGTDTSDIPQDCREIIDKSDFRYRQPTPDEQEKIMLHVLKTIDSDSLSIVGPDKKPVWEKGWSENLKNFIEKDYDIGELTPKYVRPNQPIRFRSGYIIPYDANFEANFFKVYRLWLFKKYLKDVDSIFEFGCGTGHNLALLARLYPEKKLHGLDWAGASIELVNNINKAYGYNIATHLFDMFSPDDNLEIPHNSAIITMGALEQLGANYEKFLQFILKKSVALCLHSEPICELYDEDSFIDYLFIKYHKKRQYLKDYLTRLKRLESEAKIDIVKIHRPLIGNLFQEGYSIIAWKTKR